MIRKSTPEIEETVCDEGLVKMLKKVYKKDLQHPSKSSLQFIFGYAASYESYDSALIGQLGVMKN